MSMILPFVSKTCIFSFLLSNSDFPGSLESWLLFMFCGYEIPWDMKNMEKREDFLISVSFTACR